MLTKILFTAAIIAAVVVYLRYRAQKRFEGSSTPGPRLINPPPEKKNRSIGWLATAAIGLMLAGTALFLFLTWRDANEVIYLRVIDAVSGKSTQYEAYRGDIDDRRFRTTDGRHVTLAETERLETTTVRQGQN